MVMNIIIFAIIGLVVVGGLVGFVWFRMRYKTASSNEALVITGPKLGDPDQEKNVFEDDNGRSVKIIRGGGYRLRMFQTATPIDLTSFQLQVNSEKAYTKEGIPIRVVSTAVVSIGSELGIMANFAEKFLGKKQSERESELKDVLNGHLRSIIASLPIEKVYNDFKEVNSQVKKIAESDLKGMGFEITSFALNDVEDVDKENGYIDALGRPHIANVQKKADMAESDATKETRMYQAKNDQEAENEEYVRQTEVAQARKEKDIKDQQFKRETEREKAETEASYDLEKNKRELEVQQEEIKVNRQRKEEELRISKYEREQNVEIEREEAKVRKEKADADYYEQTRLADAEAAKVKSAGQAKADTEEAEGVAQAKILRERGQAEADNIRQIGEAESESIRLKGIAEAEALEAKAEAFDKYGEAAMADMLIKVLPELARAISEPMSNVDEIKILDGGSGQGMNGLQNSVMGNMASIRESLKTSTGMDLNELIQNFSGKGNFKGELGSIANSLNGGQAEDVVEDIDDVEVDGVEKETSHEEVSGEETDQE